jgi:hypothetical protein
VDIPGTQHSTISPSPDKFKGFRQVELWITYDNFEQRARSEGVVGFAGESFPKVLEQV